MHRPRHIDSLSPRPCKPGRRTAEAALLYQDAEDLHGQAVRPADRHGPLAFTSRVARSCRDHLARVGVQSLRVVPAPSRLQLRGLELVRSPAGQSVPAAMARATVGDAVRSGEMVSGLRGVPVWESVTSVGVLAGPQIVLEFRSSEGALANAPRGRGLECGQSGGRLPIRKDGGSAPSDVLAGLSGRGCRQTRDKARWLQTGPRPESPANSGGVS